MWLERSCVRERGRGRARDKAVGSGAGLRFAIVKWYLR
jgi:hypothetical protein